MNRYLPGSLKIYSDKGLWYLYRTIDAYLYQTIDANGQPVRVRVPYFDGIQIVDGAPKVKFGEAQKVERDKLKIGKDIIKFCRKIRDAKDPLPLPNSGDCWFCSMFHPVPAVEGEATRDMMRMPRPADYTPGDTSHLLAHIKEGYLHGSLIVNAMRWGGFTDQQIGLYLQAPYLKDRVANTVRRYLRSQLGLAA